MSSALAKSGRHSEGTPSFCRHLPAALLALALVSWGGHARAAEVADAGPVAATATPADAATDATFDRSMLSGAGQNTTDLSRFERGDFVLPGNYSVDIYLNNVSAGRSEIRLATPSADVSATPCTTRALLDTLGLHPTELSTQIIAELADAHACVDIGSVIPGAHITFDVGNLRLDVSVPQAYMGLQARGYVDPKYWDSGVNAGLLNYNFNSYRTSSAGISQTSSYLGVNAGLNLGRWHLRHNASLTWQSAVGNTRSTHHWQGISTYAQRDLPALHAQLTLGDSFTSGEMFDSFGLRGVQLATDDRMLPQSLRGYAPTVRGVADGNAKVTVRQNGMMIYQTTVAPGPFTIDDLYATGYGGDLDVSVSEANGRVHTFSVPYASVPQLLRPGVTRFSVAAGQLRNRAILTKPGVVQATMQRGFNNLLTGYAGVEASPGYGALLLGSALNTRHGAFAMDVSAARTQIPGLDTMSGQSLRLSYSKTMVQTGTSLTVAAYRYSTDGYLTLDEAVRARDYSRRGLPVFASGSTTPIVINGVPVSGLLTPAQQAALAGIDLNNLLVPAGVDRQRNNFSISLNQQLGERGGSLYVNGSARDYWNRSGADTQFQLGYNNSIGPVSYNLSASRERDLFGRSDNRYMANVTIPLGSSSHAPLFTAGLSRSSSGNTQQQATLGGTAGDDNRFSYGATATHDGGDNNSNSSVGSTASVNGGYHGAHIQLNAGFGVGDGYSQASLNVAGGIVAHPGGITFGQPLGDTVAIVEAPDANGARIGNAAGVRIGPSGYALVPYLTPYVLDTVTIDPSGLPLDVQLDNTSTQLAPRAGAVVMVKFKSESGRFLLFQAQLENGKTLPFGAEVTDEQNHTVGVVGQVGQIMVRVPHESGQLKVQWESIAGSVDRCVFDYRAPAKAASDPASRYAAQHVVCRKAEINEAAEEHKHGQ
ncbi:fimbrial biogenesis outer membrane usher protein [Rhodanobacter sp. AS-Z3]|uniref:fimbria/pilus outer membrane usher protein n=1 Tax=Rhodanobacter sp. AS-Z3 TaxID=3031330 RepID=UPI0024794B80|nr:fimbria/pilus outer membrane usher protein [Rhodanobacter sp. AS-Z3]WEN15217.1 fimbrial biogenesis outer membrane usher protein [Rhodanobacter sp. AS-Z3]